MTQPTTRIPISSIVLDEDIYPRKGIDHRRAGIFAENIRDGFKFEPIEVEPDPDKPGRYRLLDGAHRWDAYRSTGLTEAEAVIKNLDGTDPLLYAAKKAIGPRQLTEDEARDTARRAYNKNPALTSSDIGKAIGRARRTVDSYIADLRAATRLGIELKIFRMNSLGIPQDRIAKRLGLVRTSLHYHLSKMAKLPNSTNTDLSQGFTVSQVAEKHGWTEPMVWSLALKGREDIERFKELGWGLRTWDQWEWNDCDKRFGDDWPGRIPAQLIAHILYYFSKQNDLILDPMAGGGVTPDTCLALSRRCWAFDMTDRSETRPEIEPHTWTLPTANPPASPERAGSRWRAGQLAWPVSSKEKPDLIIFDPPYFDKKAADYDRSLCRNTCNHIAFAIYCVAVWAMAHYVVLLCRSVLFLQEAHRKSISGLPKKEYLEFLEAFFALLKLNAKKTTRLAFINADWRDFQNKPAMEELHEASILIDDYLQRSR